MNGKAMKFKYPESWKAFIRPKYLKALAICLVAWLIGGGALGVTFAVGAGVWAFSRIVDDDD